MAPDSSPSSVRARAEAPRPKSLRAHPDGQILVTRGARLKRASALRAWRGRFFLFSLIHWLDWIFILSDTLKVTGLRDYCVVARRTFDRAFCASSARQEWWHWCGV